MYLYENISIKMCSCTNTRKVKVLSLPETIQEKIDVSSEGPSSGVSSGGQGKTTRVFIRVDTKTSRFQRLTRASVSDKDR